jgi:hypothetical protein
MDGETRTQPVRLVIGASERTTLEQWARRRTTAQGFGATRADHFGVRSGQAALEHPRATT